MTFGNFNSNSIFGVSDTTSFEDIFNSVLGNSVGGAPVKTVAEEGFIKHVVPVPGFGADDVEVSIESARVLTIRTKAREEEKSRTLARAGLVQGADYVNAKASVKNGLLTVTVPYSSVPAKNFILNVTAE
ncbi:MAG: Hsp20 family protein [Leuconostoc sp.]|nr:Hsp20 family protein [Leuconostoc sp.]